ncbi:hypothetical protein AB0K09_25290 [Streptomyces sp. NPDC049577]|uniref:hypothetical protein n=1 Tax=Streptomyces sp. NPDC049577 TaxID=3155153 RepID=UPI00343F5770
MVAVAFLLPPLMLCLVLALGRYEERLLKNPGQPRHVPGERHLSVVPDPPSGRRPRRGPGTGRATGRGGRHAA